MLGHVVRNIVLAGLITGLCAPVWANAMSANQEKSDVAPIVMQDNGVDGLQLAQTDLVLEYDFDTFSTGVVAESVESPSVMPMTPPSRIALLLPTRSDSLLQVADAVRAGFMAAWQHEPANIVVNLIETGDAPQDVLTGYQRAVAENDIVVGPLTRSGVTAIQQSGAVIKPTIALAQPDSSERVVANLLPIGLSVEEEARQIASLNGRGSKASKALAISTGVPWQRRAAAAFVASWRSMGLPAEAIELTMTGGFIAPDTLLALRSRLQTARPAMLFVALDAAQTMQLRLGIGGEVTTWGISQLNPHARADWPDAVPLFDLEGVHLLDMPWQLQADHAAVMTYPQLPAVAEQRRSPDAERLYALGIDAYRIAHELVLRRTQFTLDGVTGTLSVRFDGIHPQFERVLQPAIYREGVVQPLDRQ